MTARTSKPATAPSKVEAPNSAESTAVNVCTQIPWQKVITSATPFIKKYGSQILAGIGALSGSLSTCCAPKVSIPGIPGSGDPTFTPAPGNKKATNGNTGTEIADDVACCLKACAPKIKVPDVADGKLPTIPGNKKTTNGGGLGSDTSSAIDYPNPFQEKLYEDSPASKTSAKRISAAFKRRLSRASVRGAVSPNNRSSAIYEPAAFDPSAVTNN